MKNLFPVLLIIVIISSCKPVQQKPAINPNPVVVAYFDKYWSQVPTKSAAHYYRVVKGLEDGKFLVQDFYMSGKSQMDPVICTAYLPKLKWEGKGKLYYENGTLKEEGFFKDEKRNGAFTQWYEDGTKQMEVVYESDVIKRYNQYWSLEGEPLLINGTGTIVLESPYSGLKNVTEIENHEPVCGFVVHPGADTVFVLVQTPPVYNGGLQAMSQKVVQNLKYPASARRMNVEGTVYIEFIVDENGRSTNHGVLKGIGKDCDDESLRVVSMLQEWTPGMHKGKKVKVKFIYPIRFRLE